MIELVTRPVFNEVGDDYDADELENNWETWNPDPIDASVTTNAVSRRLDHWPSSWCSLTKMACDEVLCCFYFPLTIEATHSLRCSEGQKIVHKHK